MKDDKLPSFRDRDREHLPDVGPSLHGVREVEIHNITPLDTKIPYYGLVGPEDDGTPQGGALVLSQAQVRHIHAEMDKLIQAWDTEPRDLVAEVDSVLRDARHVGRNRASTGYEIERFEAGGTTVRVYHHDGRGRIAEDSPVVTALYAYATALKAAGYLGVEVRAADGVRPALVEAIPPPATEF